MARELVQYDSSIVWPEGKGPQIKVDGNPNWQSITDDGGFIRGIDHVVAMKDGVALFDKALLKTGPAAFAVLVRLAPNKRGDNKHAEFLLINEWKWPLLNDLNQIPQGGLKPSETPEDAIRREVREETGYEPEGLAQIGALVFDSAHEGDFQPIYLAMVPYDQKAGNLQLEAEEDIKPQNWMRMKEIRRLGITDSKSLAALRLAQDVIKPRLLR